MNKNNKNYKSWQCICLISINISFNSPFVANRYDFTKKRFPWLFLGVHTFGEPTQLLHGAVAQIEAFKTSVTFDNEVSAGGKVVEVVTPPDNYYYGTWGHDGFQK